MSANPSLTYDEGGGSCPHTLTLAPTQDVRPQTIAVEWDGAGASGSFLACLSLYSQSGVLIARTCPPVTFAAGDTGVVTYAPFLGREPESAPPIVVGSPPFGIQDTSDNYNVYVSVSTDPAGDATALSSFTDGATQVEGIHNARLSPDGTLVVFEYENTSTGLTELWVVAASPASTATQLLADATHSLVHPSWAPDSDTIVYVRGTGATLPINGTIETVSVSGGSPTVVKASSAGFSPYRPQFNFDGSRIAYMYTKSGTPDDFRVMDADGSNDASLDNTVGNYDSNNPQSFGWARASNVLAYNNGGGGTDAWYINDDGTGKTQLNTSGPAVGADPQLTTDCFAEDDSWILTTCNLGNGFMDLIRSDLDGSSTRLNINHGPINQAWFRGGYIYNGRIWFIESASSANGGKLSSVLPDGTDYRVDLDVNAGAALNWFFGGDGFVFN